MLVMARFTTVQDITVFSAASIPTIWRHLEAFVQPFARIDAALIMQVSDLDGTMVGETEEADAATREFCTYWEENAALSGGILVYNTGRSLGQFKSLWVSKKGDLPLPDVLITAVGTKVTPSLHLATYQMP
jgi:hypothetical protein